MRVLVLNSGSSSLKYQLIDTDTGEVRRKGLVERIGGPDVPDHRAALHGLLADLRAERIDAFGHRVVHGGETFREPTVVDAATLGVLEALTPLAPLHNPPALQGIRAALELRPEAPNVAVFDTAFHATLPPRAYLYAVPRELYEQHGVRRYGFHGTSHDHVSREAARVLQRPLAELRLVTLHLGNGASATAVHGGRSVDTTMGFTPLEGLVMGTRSGDIDPALALWLAGREGVERAGAILNRESGLLGLSGVSNDLRDVHRAREAGDERAAQALDVMVYRLVKTVGAYAVAMQGLDAVVFTGGVGENDRWVRARVVEGLSLLGLRLDADANARGETRITTSEGPAALVIPTNEERMIAEGTAGALRATGAT